MTLNNCGFCGNSIDQCRRSNRRAMSFDMTMQEKFNNFAVVPCSFKERLNDIADKWIWAQTSEQYSYDLYLDKTNTRTLICGPFWMSLLRHHEVQMGDVITSEVFTDDVDDAELEDDEEDSEEDKLLELFESKMLITVRDAAGNVKPHIELPGYQLFDLPSQIREVLHKTAFSNIHDISEGNMADIIWEMYTEVYKFYEDEFYHVPDLQYVVHRVTYADMVVHCLLMLREVLRGFNCPTFGEALY